MIAISDKTLPLGLDSLRRVSLASCTLDWNDAKFLVNLTHLRVSSGQLGALFEYGVKHLLEILRKMPALESIDLEYFTEYRERSTVEPLPLDYQRVSLPHLKMLRLAVQMSHLETILPALDLPSDAVLKLYCFDQTELISSFPCILSACSMHLQPPNTPNNAQSCIQSLEWFADDHREHRIRVWPTTLSQEELNAMEKPSRMETIFSWDKRIELTADIAFQNLLRSLNLERLVSLSISDIKFIDCKTCATTFGTLPRLEYIDLGQTRARGLLQAILLGIDNGESTQQSIPFPSLHSLSVSLAKVLSEDSLRTTQLLILQTLVKRSQVGLGLDQLIIRNTGGLSRKIMDQIRNVVPDVQENWTPVKEPHFFVEAYDSGLDEMDRLMGVWT